MGPPAATMTYGEFEDAVRRQAGGWLERGLAKGEVVAVMAPNCPEYGVVFHAVALAGGVLTTVNPTYTSGEVHHQLVDSGATRLVTIPMFLETATAAIADTAVKEVYVIGEADGYPSIASLDGAPLAEQVPVDLDDVVVLPYSSGTTGLAKGVMLTHRNLVANIEQTLGTVTLDEDEAFVAVLPFFHIYGMQVLMNLGLRGRRHDRHDAALRPRAVPVVASGARPHSRVRRAADGRRAGEASARRQLRPLRAAVDLLRRGAVVGRARDRVRRSGSAARSCRATA